MIYERIEEAIFKSRPNRFIAQVETSRGIEICHVKNTGRCKELLIPNCEVYVQHHDNPNRKTEYSLISVQKGNRLVNIDSQAPNAAVKEWLEQNQVIQHIQNIYPEKNLRAYPGAIRGTEEWNNTYKIRTTVERDINHIKDNLCLAGRRTQNEKTLHADLILAGITQLITVVLSDKINHHEFIRSLKPLIA